MVVLQVVKLTFIVYRNKVFISIDIIYEIVAYLSKKFETVTRK